jgi:UDP-glucose 4-epimerase
LGTKNGFSVKEVIAETKKVIDKRFEVDTHGRRAGDPGILVADNERAVRILK